MWASCSATVSPLVYNGFRPRGCTSSPHSDQKKVVIIGAGWAGLSSAHHLTKQGFDVTLIEAGNGPVPEVGIRGFWYPYRNIFSIVDELGINPFTKPTRSAYYSPETMEVKFPVFKDLPRLPAPFAALAYPQFLRLPLVDRLTSVALLYAVIDFDNTDTAWRKYDSMTARELFKQFGCSERLYREVFEPFLQVGLFAPAEQCSASVTLGMLYYYILAHQENFDVVWCRGSVEEKILKPWLEAIKVKGCKLIENQSVTEFLVNEDTGCVSAVLCGHKTYEADAVVLAVGISNLQSIINSSSVLQSQKEFLNVLNLSTIDVVSVKLWFDRKVVIPNEANVCFGFDDSSAWTFFDLNSIYDEYEHEPGTVVEVEFYYAKQLLPLKDEKIVSKAILYLSRCIREFEEVMVLQQVVNRFSKSATHFFPGFERPSFETFQVNEGMLSRAFCDGQMTINWDSRLLGPYESHSFVQKHHRVEGFENRRIHQSRSEDFRADRKDNSQ